MQNYTQDTHFLSLCKEVLSSSSYQTLKTYRQHGVISTYNHCLSVAYTAYCMNRKYGLGIDEREVVLAGLLHDYYLYDWHSKTIRLHGYRHPGIASRNAQRDFHISRNCQKAIETHMWPLTFFHIPSSRLGWVLTIADKKCSTIETLFRRH